VVTEHKSRSDEFLLYPIGDIHYGARGCEVDTLKRTIEEVRSKPNAYWLGMGDYSEAVTVADKRFDFRSVDPKLIPYLDDITGKCTRDLVALFEPIKHKSLGLLTGNHDDKLRLRDSNDVHGALCVALGAKNLGYTSILRWTFRRGKGGPSSVVKMYVSHGTIASRRPGAKINRMEDVARQFDVDLSLFGHGHSKLVSEWVELGVPDSGAMRLIERVKPVVMSGTFRRCHTLGTLDYAEKGGYPPSPIGCPKITIRPWAEPRRRFEVAIG
jgi:hypothetical protein